MKNLIIKTAAACMPGSCWGQYGKIALLEVEPGLEAGDIKMISNRARGVIKVVEIWDRLSMGITKRCAFSRGMAEAEKMKSELEV